MPADRNSIKKVIVVGAGFAGIKVCKKLVNCPQCELVLVDRNNYHLFQPLLYQVAMQQGAFIGRLIRSELRGKPRNHFRYFDKGMMATIGRSRAVVSSHGIRLTGLFAWIIWALVHILFLIEFKNRFFVFLQWAWAYFSFGRGARLILRKDWRLYDQPNGDHLNLTNTIQTSAEPIEPTEFPNKTGD